MPFGRSHNRSKSRSPAPGSTFPTAIPLSPSRPPTFLPPSHYAAAAGIKYEPVHSSPHTTSEVHEAHSSQLGRLLGRTSSRGTPSRPDSVAEEKEPGKGKRKSQLGNIPLLEVQLLPSLRDTVDRMTQLPQTRVDPTDLNDTHSVHSSQSQSLAYRRRKEDFPAVAVLSPSSSSPVYKVPPSRSTTDSVPSTGIPRLNQMPPSMPKSALKSPARRGVLTPTIPVPASPQYTPKPTRSTYKGDATPADADYSTDTSSGHKMREEHPRGGKIPVPKTSLSKPSSLSKLRAEYKSKSNPGTPQHTQNLGFSTPQPGRPTASPLPSSLPRPRPSRHTPLPPSDSGSELERRVSLRHSPGRLVVTNAVIVPSSSESDHAVKSRNRRSQWISSKDAPILPPPPPPPPTSAPRTQPRPSARQRSHKDVAAPIDRRSNAVGLGLNVGLGRRHDKVLVDSDEESIYGDQLSDHSLLTDEPVLVSSEDDDESVYGDDPPHQPHTPSSSQEGRNVEHERQKAALLGLVDGLHRDFGRPQSSGARSSLTHSENDNEYSAQGFAISGSTELEDAGGSRDSRMNRTGRRNATRDWDEESTYSDEDPPNPNVASMGFRPRAMAQDSKTSRNSRTSLSSDRNSWKRSSSALGVREDVHREDTSPARLGSGERRRSVSPMTVPLSSHPRSPRIPLRSMSPLPTSPSPALRTGDMRGSSGETWRRSKHLEKVDSPSINAPSYDSRSSRSSRALSGLYGGTGLDIPRRPEDAGLRERLAFGIPESLSYCGNDVTPDEDESIRPPLSRLGSAWSASSRPGLPRVESDLSVAESQWEQQTRFSKELSSGAAALFENLTTKAVRFMDGHEERDDFPSGYEQDRTPVAEPSSWIDGKTRTSSANSALDHEAGRQLLDDSSMTSTSGSSSLSSISNYDPSSPQHPDGEDARSDMPPVSPNNSSPDSWRSSLTPHAYNALRNHYGSTEMERQEIIYDLFATEQIFVRFSRQVIRAYFVPLRVRDSRDWLPGLPSDVARLFDWLEDIVNFHATIARAIAAVVAIWKTGSIVQRIASTLRAFVPQFEVYVPYLVKFDAVREVVRWHTEKDDGEFGQYLRMKAKEREKTDVGEDRGWSLEKLFDEPPSRLRHYLQVYQRLCELTPQEHPDHLATVSLLYATRMAIRVMDEVKTREEEYDFVKDLASRIDGLSDATPLARRARRLLWYGSLLYGRSVPVSPGRDTVAMSEKQHDTLMYQPQKMPKLVTAVRHWDARRSRAASITSSASSTLSVRSYESTSSASVLVTPTSDHFPMLGSRTRSGSFGKPLSKASFIPARSIGRTVDAARALNVMVFSDLIVLAVPNNAKPGIQPTGEEQQRCTLMNDVGLSRVLDFHEAGDNVTVALVSISPEYLDSGLIAEESSVRSIVLTLPGNKDANGDRGAFLNAVRKCQNHTIRALSFPSLPGSMMEDLEIDTRHSLVGILSSGLPLPKSPSIQFEEATQGRRREAADGEREERGWWTLRFQQVLRELQREDASLV